MLVGWTVLDYGGGEYSRNRWRVVKSWSFLRGYPKCWGHMIAGGPNGEQNVDNLSKREKVCVYIYIYMYISRAPGIVATVPCRKFPGWAPDII